MAQKLKKMHLTSVDLVRAGANQEADICLYKSAAPYPSEEEPTEEEKNIFQRFLRWLCEGPEEDTVEKEAAPFHTVQNIRECGEILWKYTDALTQSIQSIQNDAALSAEDKLEMMDQSLGQFHDAMTELFPLLCGEKSWGEGAAFDDIEET